MFPRRTLRCGLAVALALAAGFTARGDGMAEIVVASRYLQQTGQSHAHLFPYREDGKLLRQLTSANSGQDQDPVFAPDGATIVFTRDLGTAKQIWSIQPLGGGLHKLDAAPAWYTQSTTAPYFTSNPNGMQFDDPPPSYTAPDGSVELILKADKNDQNDQYDGPGHGENYILRDLKTNTDAAMGKLPGFVGLMDLMFFPPPNGTERFLFVPPLRVAFFALHLNSTDGDTVSALDLNARRLVQLCPNNVGVFPLPGEPGFLTEAFPRYIPYGDGTHTANCSYIEHWDATLNKIRYAQGQNAAAICYGASMYRPGATPAVITIHLDGWPADAAANGQGG